MKKNILMVAQGDKRWMGGVTYTKNLLYMMSFIENVEDKYNIFLYISKEIQKEFEGLKKNIEYVYKNGDKDQILEVCDTYKIDVVLPIQRVDYSWAIIDKCIYWIPDFQEAHFPENFTAGELRYRKRHNSYIADNHRCLILSSEDALKDYINIGYKNENVFVVHFSSYIDKEVEKLSDRYVNKIMEKYSLNFPYIYIANQFWKHKNYETALEAVSILHNQYHKDVHLVCTGYMRKNDGLEDQYTEELLQYIKDHKIESQIHLLGVVDREEQLAIMKNADLLIQPSLFEGWGCSVEDAKVMGKSMVLSDIDVHKEQANENCILFEKKNAVDLATKILGALQIEKRYEIQQGILYTRKKTKEYAQNLEKAIDSIKIHEKYGAMDLVRSVRIQKIKELFDYNKYRKIAIYGTGKHTEMLLKYCRDMVDISKIIYIDSNCSKWGQEYYGGTIYPPEDICNYDIDRIIISTVEFQDEIYEELMKKELGDIDIVKIYESEKEKMESVFI